MKAVAVQSFGGPDGLVVVDQPIPVPRATEALVRVDAAGVGLADALLREGNFRQPELPFVPGLEAAGTVVSVGDAVDHALVGSRVFVMVAEGIKSGCYAEYIAVDSSVLVPIPDKLSATEAVALGVNALVGKCIVERANLKPTDAVLVRGAGGGIGVMLTQCAARTGATVVASTSSEDRAKRLLELGATHVVDRSADALVASHAADSPIDWLSAGFDAILDPVAGPGLLSFVEKLRPNGRLILAGVAGGLPPTEFGMALFSPRSLTFSLLSLDSLAEVDKSNGFREIFTMAEHGDVEPVIHTVLSLAEARQAHLMLQSGEVFGKIVLEPQHDEKPHA